MEARSHLRVAGLTMAHVVDATVLLADMAYYGEMNTEVRASPASLVGSHWSFLCVFFLNTSTASGLRTAFLLRVRHLQSRYIGCVRVCLWLFFFHQSLFATGAAAQGAGGDQGRCGQLPSVQSLSRFTHTQYKAPSLVLARSRRRRR